MHLKFIMKVIKSFIQGLYSIVYNNIYNIYNIKFYYKLIVIYLNF
jgi:hypothetical protein